jgi:hypothetical protein
MTMNPLFDSQREPKKLFRNPFLYSSILIAVAALYVGFVFYSRSQENKAIERRAAGKKIEEDRHIVEMLGGKSLEIQSFYASPGVIHRGETVQLCYGVANAKKVTLDPPVGPVWPSYARCLDAYPTKNTTYTLIAEDAAGTAKTSTVTVQVR